MSNGRQALLGGIRLDGSATSAVLGSTREGSGAGEEHCEARVQVGAAYIRAR